jgi:thioredoxin-like negative regulator of GroEL
MDYFIKNNRVCLVYFTNENFTELNNKIGGLQKSISNSKFLVIDSDKEVEIIDALNIKSIPLIHIYKNGQLIEEIFGTYTNICDIIRLHF